MAVLGYNIIPTLGEINSTAKGIACVFTATEDGEAYEMVVYSRLTGDANHKFGLFSDSAGIIDSQLAETNPGAISTTYAWRTLSFITPYNFVNGEKLWLRAITEDNIVYPYDNGGTNQHAQTNPEYELTVGSGNFINPADPADAYYPVVAGMYINYTPTAGLLIANRSGVSLANIAAVSGTPIANIANITGIL